MRERIDSWSNIHVLLDLIDPIYEAALETAEDMIEVLSQRFPRVRDQYTLEGKPHIHIRMLKYTGRNREHFSPHYDEHLLTGALYDSYPGLFVRGRGGEDIPIQHKDEVAIIYMGKSCEANVSQSIPMGLHKVHTQGMEPDTEERISIMLHLDSINPGSDIKIQDHEREYPSNVPTELLLNHREVTAQ